MGNKLNHDMLSLIYDLTNNYYCTLVCKDFYNIIQQNAIQCQTCNKFIKIFNHVQWITDPKDDEITCHGYYKNIEYYTMIKRMISLQPKFINVVDRQCYALSLYAIKCNPLTIQFIKNPNEPLCNIAMNKNIECIKYIKNPTLEWCWKSIQSNPWLLEFIPDNILTDGMVMYCIKKNGLLLQLIPDRQTLDMCWAAVYNNIKAIQYVSEINQTDELCLYVLGKDYHLFEYIKKPKEEYYCKVFELAPNYFNTLFKSSMNNTSFGFRALENCLGSNNIGYGYQSGYNMVTGNNSIYIGNSGLRRDDRVIRIGDKQLKNYQAGIYGNNVKGVPVYVSPDGELGTFK